MPEQPRLDLGRLERGPKQRVGTQVDLPDSQVVGSPPPGIDRREIVPIDPHEAAREGIDLIRCRGWGGGLGRGHGSMPPGILGAHKPSGVARRARRRRNVDSPAVAAAATGPMSVTGRSQGGRSRLTTPTVRLNHAGRPSPGEVGPPASGVESGGRASGCRGQLLGDAGCPVLDLLPVPEVAGRCLDGLDDDPLPQFRSSGSSRPAKSA